jgi:hypothetical protein
MICAEADPLSGSGAGCGSRNIGLAKNRPRVGDCRIRVEQLGDPKVPASFQFERAGDDLDLPIVRVNLASPRYIELRGTGSMSGQAQKRLKQFLVDVSLVAIAEYNAETKNSAFSQELGIKQYESQLSKLLETSDSSSEEAMLAVV